MEATKMGARTVGSDIDPVAWFVTKKEVEPFDKTAFAEALATLEGAVGQNLAQYYRTTLKDGRQAIVTNYFWVATLDCPACSKTVELHPHYVLWHEKKRHEFSQSEGKKPESSRKVVFCRECHEVHEVAGRAASLLCPCGARTLIGQGTTKGGRYSCTCGHTGKLLDRVKPGVPLATRLFALEWEIVRGSRSTNERGFAKATAADLATYASAEETLEKLRDQLPIPSHEIPTKDRRDNRPINYGFSRYSQLFNSRQQLALGTILAAIRKVPSESVREYLVLAFSDALASNNMLCPYAFGYRKLTPLFGLHAYRMITRPVEGNAWGAFYGRGSFKKCAEKVARGKEYCTNPVEYWGSRKATRPTGEKIEATTTTSGDEWRTGKARALLLNQSSTKLAALKDGEVDVILTDPPYYNNLPYSELSDFFFAWIRDDLPSGATWRQTSTPYRESLFVQRNTEEQYRQYETGMVDVFTECRRVLNKDGIMIFTYHHLDPRAWLALSQALNSAGLAVTHAFPLLAEGKSGFHSSEGNIKWDAVFCCRPSGMRERSPLNEATWVSSWTKAVGLRMNLVARGARLGQADKRSLAMALTVAQATHQPISEGDMFLLLRKIANLHATARLKLNPNARVRPHRTRTAKWFVKEAEDATSDSKRKKRTKR